MRREDEEGGRELTCMWGSPDPGSSYLSNNYGLSTSCGSDTVCMLRTQQCSQVLKGLMLNKDFDDDQHHGQQLGVGAWNDIKCAGGGCCFSCGAIPDGISGKVRFEQSPEGGEGALWRSRGRASSSRNSQCQGLRLVCLSRKEAEKAEVQCLGRWGWRRQKSGRGTHCGGLGSRGGV